MLQSCPEPDSPITLVDIEFSHKAAVVPLKDVGNEEYLLLENKVNIPGTWTEYLPGDGLLISHIDNSIISSKWSSSTINSGSSNNHGVNIVEADGDNALWLATDSGSLTEPYYGGNTDTLANRPLNEGGVSSVSITQISGKDSEMSFFVE